METYSFLRAFADSWAMMSLFAVFVGMAFWIFRPSAKASHDDAANSIFRHETKPVGQANPVKEA